MEIFDFDFIISFNQKVNIKLRSFYLAIVITKYLFNIIIFWISILFEAYESMTSRW